MNQQHKILLFSLFLIISILTNGIPVGSANNITNTVFDNSNFNSQNNKVKALNSTFSIVTTLSFIADFVQNIVGNLFEVKSVVTGTEDPHSFSPKPSDITLIQNANVFVVFGIADIDGWAQTIINSPPANLKIIKLANLQQDGITDPFLGSNGELNPHLWMSPKFVNSTILQRIYDGLSTIDKVHKSVYLTNLNKYRIELGTLITEMNSNATILKTNHVIVLEYHPAFFYLFHDMNITRIGTIEQVENQEPSASHVAQITNLVKQKLSEGYDVILVQAMNLSNTTTVQVSRDTGAKIAYLAALMGIYPQITFTNYIQMIQFDLNALNNPISVPKTNSLNLTFLYIIIPIVLLAIIYLLTKKKRI